MQQLTETNRVKTSNESGMCNERRTTALLQEGGLYVVDTSEGAHNLHYHDKLVSKKFIRRDGASGCIPLYRTDARVILSFEDKCYKHSNKLGGEIQKFAEIRSAMQIGRQRGLFIWYSTASIPSRGHRRKYTEYEQLEDGRFCVTGWIGADDVSEEEVVRFAQEIIEQQECLMDLRTRLPLENDTIQSLTAVSEQTMKLARTQLAQVDAMTASLKELEKQRDNVRRTVLEMLLRQYATLKEQHLLTKSDQPLEDSLMSLKNERRTTADKIIENKDEFMHLQMHLNRCSHDHKRKRVDYAT